MEEKNIKREYLKSIRRVVREVVEKHKNTEPYWFKYAFQFFITILATFVTWLVTSSASVDTAQNRYTEEKIGHYINLVSMLRDGRNPQGRRHEIDTLPVHRNYQTMNKWWREIDDYYQKHWLFFDDVSRSKYKNLNQFVFDQMDTLELHPDASVEYRHMMKQPLVDSCEGLIQWFREYLNEKYDTESGVKF